MPSSIFLLLLLLLLHGAVGDVESDRRECGDALMGLATCLTYVGGNSKSPTPDCCAGLRQMLSSSPKCLCLLIKDHDNPAVDLKMDPVRAMSLPSECGAPANISQCPKLLHLPSDSPDAKIFEDFKNKSHGNGSADGSMGGLSGSNLVAGYAGRSAFCCTGRWWWMGMEAVICLVASLLVLLLGS